MLMNISSSAAGRAVSAVALTCGSVLAATLLAACGSQAGQSTSAASGGATPSSPAATPSSPAAASSPSDSPTAQTEPMIPATQCPTSALRATVVKSRGGAAAGTFYVPIDFT